MDRDCCHKRILCTGTQALPGGGGGAASCATVITRRNPHGRTAATQQARTILVTTEGAPPRPSSLVQRDLGTKGGTCQLHMTARFVVQMPWRDVDHAALCSAGRFVIWLFCDCRWAPGGGH